MSNALQSKHSFRDHIKKALHDYFKTLEGENTSKLYHLVLAEVEQPLLETVMHYAEGNQTKAAQWLGLNRATLRKLLEKYDMR